MSNLQPLIKKEFILPFFWSSFFLCCIFLLTERALANKDLSGIAAGINSTEKFIKIQADIDIHRQKVLKAQEEKFNLQQELKLIETQLKEGQANLMNLHQQLSAQEDHLQKKSAEKNIIISQKEYMMERVEKRLAAYYQNGDLAVINTIFRAKTLPDIINLNEYFNAMFQNDEQIFQTYLAQISLIESAQEKINEVKENLQKLITEISEQENLLLAKQQERNVLLNRVRIEEFLYVQAMEEMEMAAADLNDHQKTSKNILSANKRKIIRSKNLKK